MNQSSCLVFSWVLFAQPASAVALARLLVAHCRHSHAEVPRQCEADMSGIGQLNWTHKDLAATGYIYNLFTTFGLGHPLKNVQN